jgi:transposase InsO family protein
VGAERELKEMIKVWNPKPKELKEFGAERGMEWKFSTHAAPHQNGSAESLVKSTKKALKNNSSTSPHSVRVLHLSNGNFQPDQPTSDWSNT